MSVYIHVYLHYLQYWYTTYLCSMVYNVYIYMQCMHIYMHIYTKILNIWHLCINVHIYIYTRWIKEDAELLPHTPWRWETSIGVATMLGPYAGFAMFCPTGGKWRQWRLHLAFTYINGYLIKVYMEHGYYYMGTIKWVLLYIYIYHR